MRPAAAALLFLAAGLPAAGPLLVVQSPGTLISFGNIDVYGSSVPVTVTLKNDSTAGAPLNITSITKTGQDAAQFVVVDATPYSNVAPGSSVTFSVTFTPKFYGPAACDLSIASDDPASPTTIQLTGTGLAGASPGGAGCGLLGLEVALLLGLRRARYWLKR
ncbi:MAG TPA: choice-of-anchor D domain-containing protein [Planctomycetota bacterium]|nr:choice-of-anchor D domain-containing protein [Planctomycetota bacterium]